jgi:hypothetical protein
MSNGDLPRPPITNEIVLLQAINGYIYSVIFWGPKLLGFPVLPPVFGARQIALPRGGTYSFT